MEGLVLNCVSEVGSVWAATDLLCSLNQGNEMGSLELPLTRQQSGAHRTRLKEQKVPLGKEWSLVLGRTTPQAKRSSNEHRKKKSSLSKAQKRFRGGPFAAPPAHKWPEAIPVTELAFPNGKTRRWQTVTYSQAHTLTKPHVSIFFKNYY